MQKEQHPKIVYAAADLIKRAVEELCKGGMDEKQAEEKVKQRFYELNQRGDIITVDELIKVNK